MEEVGLGKVRGGLQCRKQSRIKQNKERFCKHNERCGHRRAAHRLWDGFRETGMRKMQTDSSFPFSGFAGLWAGCEWSRSLGARSDEWLARNSTKSNNKDDDSDQNRTKTGDGECKRYRNQGGGWGEVPSTGG